MYVDFVYFDSFQSLFGKKILLFNRFARKVLIGRWPERIPPACYRTHTPSGIRADGSSVARESLQRLRLRPLHEGQ